MENERERERERERESMPKSIGKITERERLAKKHWDHLLHSPSGSFFGGRWGEVKKTCSVHGLEICFFLCLVTPPSGYAFICA